MSMEVGTCETRKVIRPRKSILDEFKKAPEKASWVSRNEGVHEKVNFDDTLWGFNLAGGIYYNTPLRVTSVREGSRASFAGIKPGDILKRINDIDSSTLTIQEAHDMILESGIHIRLAVTSPEDKETRHNVWQDEYEEDEVEKKYKYEHSSKKVHKEFKGARTNLAWSLMWPWTCRRGVFYRESNCFLVPSRYEAEHPDKLRSPGPEETTIAMEHKSKDEIVNLSRE